MAQQIKDYILGDIMELSQKTLLLPKGAKILSVSNTGNNIRIFATVNTEEKETEEYNFVWYTADVPLKHDDSYMFLGVCILHCHEVYHMFYKKN